MSGAEPVKPRLPQRGRRNAPSQDGATWLALAGMMAIILGLLGLVSLVLPAELRVVILLVATVGGFLGGHYLIWGRWLQRRLTRGTQQGPEQFWKRPAPPVDLDEDP